MITVSGTSFLFSKFDGILGMAWQTISVDNIEPVYRTMYKLGILDDESFAFYLTRTANKDGSTLTLGGVNKNLSKNDWKYVNLTETDYWLIKIDKITVGDTKIAVDSIRGIVDTGTSALVGDSSIVGLITKLIPSVSIDCSNLETLPSVTITIGGEDYILKPEDYVFQLTMSGKSVCENGWMPAQFPDKFKDVVILGDLFIRTYYTHFNYGKSRIGFATAI